MIGTNTIRLNQATMIEALQFWLNSQLLETGTKVISVVCKKDGYDETFDIELTTEDKKKEE